MEGAKDRFGPFAARVQDLMARDVKFQVCEITLRSRKLKKDQFIIASSSCPRAWCRSRTCSRRKAIAYLKP